MCSQACKQFKDLYLHLHDSVRCLADKILILIAALNLKAIRSCFCDRCCNQATQVLIPNLAIYTNCHVPLDSIEFLLTSLFIAEFQNAELS